MKYYDRARVTVRFDTDDYRCDRRIYAFDARTYRTEERRRRDSTANISARRFPVWFTALRLQVAASDGGKK